MAASSLSPATSSAAAIAPRASAEIVPAAPAGRCAAYGFIVALQGVDGAGTPFSPQWQRMMKANGARFIVDEVPAWAYEGPRKWGRVTVARWPCFEQAEAVWKKLPRPGMPRLNESGLHTAALYRGRNYGSWRPGSLELPPRCTRPTYFMSVNTTYDEPQYGIYKAALMKTSYVQKLGSTTLFSGPPTAALANWPANTSASMTHWPCKAAFEAFYLDPVYTNTIKPLRKGAIDYRIMGFPDSKHISGD